MELFFNIAWLAIVGVLGILFVARRRTVVSPITIAALVCVAMLLFPAVSVSDDLHQELPLVEDSSKRLARTLGFDRAVHFDVAAFLAIVVLTSLVVFASSVPTTLRMTRRQLDGCAQVVGSRAPPVQPA